MAMEPRRSSAETTRAASRSATAHSGSAKAAMRARLVAISKHVTKLVSGEARASSSGAERTRIAIATVVWLKRARTCWASTARRTSKRTNCSKRWWPSLTASPGGSAAWLRVGL
eukprot:scaffold88203_cov54-Phaeocystis_antarctica.AAC.1